MNRELCAVIVLQTACCDCTVLWPCAVAVCCDHVQYLRGRAAIASHRLERRPRGFPVRRSHFAARRSGQTTPVCGPTGLVERWGRGGGRLRRRRVPERGESGISVIDRTVRDELFFRRVCTGILCSWGGLWGRVSTRCNRIGRGGHRELHGTHVCRRPKAQLANPRSQEECTFCFCFFGGGLRINLVEHITRRAWGGICLRNACQMRAKCCNVLLSCLSCQSYMP